MLIYSEPSDGSYEELFGAISYVIFGIINILFDGELDGINIMETNYINENAKLIQ